MPPLAGLGFFGMAFPLPLPALPIAMEPLPALLLYTGLPITT